MPEVDCIVKQALWRNVFLRWPVYWAGYISNATGEGLVAACAAALREDRSLMVFPEGTRTRPGQPLAFQRGVGADRPGGGPRPAPGDDHLRSHHAVQG